MYIEYIDFRLVFLKIDGGLDGIQERDKSGGNQFLKFKIFSK